MAAFSPLLSRTSKQLRKELIEAYVLVEALEALLGLRTESTEGGRGEGGNGSGGGGGEGGGREPGSGEDGGGGEVGRGGGSSEGSSGGGGEICGGGESSANALTAHWSGVSVAAQTAFPSALMRHLWLPLSEREHRNAFAYEYAFAYDKHFAAHSFCFWFLP